MGDSIKNAAELDYQFGKPLDIWSGALWLGAALRIMQSEAEAGNEEALVWIDRIPDEVKARWPGIFADNDESAP